MRCSIIQTSIEFGYFFNRFSFERHLNKYHDTLKKENYLPNEIKTK